MGDIARWPASRGSESAIRITALQMPWQGAVQVVDASAVRGCLLLRECVVLILSSYAEHRSWAAYGIALGR